MKRKTPLVMALGSLFLLSSPAVFPSAFAADPAAHAAQEKPILRNFVDVVTHLENREKEVRVHWAGQSGVYILPKSAENFASLKNTLEESQRGKKRVEAKTDMWSMAILEAKTLPGEAAPSEAADSPPVHPTLPLYVSPPAR